MGVSQIVINELEKLRIDLGHRVELILTYLGLTPAAQFEVVGHAFNSNTRRAFDIPPAVMDELVGVIEQTGLPNRIKPEDTYYVDAVYRIRHQPVYVAQTPDLLDELLSAHPWRDHKKYGKLMGYSETAIMAFVGELERHDNCPSELDTSINPVFDLVLSRARWRDELQVLRGWQDTIRTHAPNLYRELVQKR